MSSIAVRSLRFAIGAARPIARAPLRAPIASSSMLARPWMRYNSSSSSSSGSSSGSSTPSSSSPSTPASSPEPESHTHHLEAPKPGSKPTPVLQVEPRLQMTFTCTAGAEKGNPTCGHRSTHEFSKRSYTKGIVLVQCPECKARHLIADHLGWFKESTEDGKLRTVEDLLRAKGEQIKKGRVTMDGDIEYAPEE